MDKVISATEARVHFGEVMRDVSERDEIVIVERAGNPKIAIISVEQLERLRQGNLDGEACDWFDCAMEARELIRQARGNQPAPDIDRLFDEMRDERDEQLLANLHRRQSRCQAHRVARKRAGSTTLAAMEGGTPSIGSAHPDSL